MRDFKSIREQIREHYRIPDSWQDLNLPGEPSKSCKSPWREDRKPSFSVYDEGRKFKDHATGETGDVYSFVAITLDYSFKDAAEWIEERVGINLPDLPPVPRRKPEPKPKKIQWPGELVKGTEATWKAFADLKGLTFPAVHAAVQGGLLRFIKAKGHKCFAVTDETRRAGEIRRIDGREFSTGKVCGLPGVDKSWLPGANFLEDTRCTTPLFLAEGSTDYLAGFDAYSRFRRAGGKRSWLPLAVLGASCKTLHPEIVDMLSNHLVRIAPDGDKAGDKMADQWGEMLSSCGCQVEILEMPRGRDLRDMLESGELKPEEVFA